MTKPGGYIAMEALFTLAVALLIATSLSNLASAAAGNARRIEKRLEAERILTSAQIMVLTMVQQGGEMREIIRRLEENFPHLPVELLPDRLVLRYAAVPDKEVVIMYAPAGSHR